MGKGHRNEIVPHSPCAWQGGLWHAAGRNAGGSGGYSRILYLDDQAPDAAGKLADYLDPTIRERCTAAFVGLGNNELRLQWLQKLVAAGYQTPVFEHPAAEVCSSAALGAGTVVLPFAFVGAGTKVGAGASSMPVPLWTITPCWKTVCTPPPVQPSSRGNRGALHESGQRRNYPQPMGKIMQLRGTGSQTMQAEF